MFDALVLAAALYCPSLPAVAQHRLPAAIFDSDPNHIWNRTHSCLFVRQSADGTDYGADALDPLLWPSTQYLLTGDSHRRALARLDEFLRSHAEKIVQDPLKRAIFPPEPGSVCCFKSTCPPNRRCAVPLRSSTM
jgi:hypothetical protein